MKPEPVFEAPWHAQLFALTVYLNEAGHFSWADWAARFGAVLKAQGVVRALDGGDDYFGAWLETLVALLAEKGMADMGALGEMTEAWRSAYLRTPHGDVVAL